MKEYELTLDRIAQYGCWLRQEEKAQATIEKYLRNIRAFASWLDGGNVTSETVIGWKEHLISLRYSPAAINTALAALNGLFRFLGWEHCRAKFLKIQRRVFRDASRELTRGEYEALVFAAREQKQDRLVLLMETICSTGIRVSEVRYITVEAARQGRAEVSLKGKIRVILLPKKLCRKLLKYAKKNGTVSGGIFLTRNGLP